MTVSVPLTVIDDTPEIGDHLWFLTNDGEFRPFIVVSYDKAYHGGLSSLSRACSGLHHYYDDDNFRCIRWLDTLKYDSLLVYFHARHTPEGTEFIKYNSRIMRRKG